MTRDSNGRIRKKVVTKRNVKRLHLQCQVVKGGALPPVEEKALRKRLAKALKVEGLLGLRRYDRLVSKRRRPVS
jgi:hypothetical protein